MQQKKRNPEKAKRAAAHPQRPGEECDAAPGSFTPVVNRARCEGKGDCVEVCPYGVFEVGTIDPRDYAALSLLGRLKSKAHRGRTALLVNAGACQACGLCVVSCPEKALTLARR